MNSIAIIPARGGSKRIPGKNIRLFHGRPMLAYALEAVHEAGIFSEIMVSTDDPEIARVAREYGANVPFMRSVLASSDTATTAQALLEVLGEYRKRGREFEMLACVYPCVPLLDAETLRKAFQQFCGSDADGLMPVCRYGHPVQRALRISATGCLEYIEPENALRRTQDFESLYHDAGMFYFARVPSFLASSSLTAGKLLPYEMPENSIQDIDNLEDWHTAEIKYRIKHGL